MSRKSRSYLICLPALIPLVLTQWATDSLLALILWRMTPVLSLYSPLLRGFCSLPCTSVTGHGWAGWAMALGTEEGSGSPEPVSSEVFAIFSVAAGETLAEGPGWRSPCSWEKAGSQEGQRRSSQTASVTTCSRETGNAQCITVTLVTEYAFLVGNHTFKIWQKMP